MTSQGVRIARQLTGRICPVRAQGLKEYRILVKLSLARQNNTQLELLHVAFMLVRSTELAEFNLGLVTEGGVTNSNKPCEIFGFVSLHRAKTTLSGVTGV